MFGVMRPYMEGSNILTLDDPNLFKYPIAYLCEPGFWTLTPAETAAMRAYLLKGGFVMVDDMIGPAAWFNFENQMRRVIPEGRLVKLDTSHPIFDSFFKINSIEMNDPNFGQQSEFWGLFEDNDPAKRLMMVVRGKEAKPRSSKPTTATCCATSSRSRLRRRASWCRP